MIALVVGLALVLFGPPPGDLPAHLYRTELVENGVLVWDTYWYAGHYPLLAYSLLYYFPAALVGNDAVALVSVVAAAALFASLAEREWGDRARWPSRVFAVVACGPLFTGTYPYAAGLAVALGALKALQLGRTWMAVVLAVVTAGLSPLAFLYLCLACVAAFLAGERRLDRRAVAMGAALLAVGLLQGALLLVYRYEAEYPFFRLSELLGVIALCAVCAALALRGERGRFLAFVFGLWALGAAAAYLVPSPHRRERDPAPGHRAPARAAGRGNRLVPAPLALRRRDHRRARLHTSALRRSGASTAATRAPRRPPSGRRRSPSWPSGPQPGERVEVVPTGDHWEAYWVPRAGFPLARGWYRQLDIAENPLFYEDTLDPAAYIRWLHNLGVRFVLLPDTQLGRVGEGREADLVRSGRAGLVEVARAGPVTVYEVPDASPVLTGPGTPQVTALEHDRVAGELTEAGTHRLAVRWTPTWRVLQGDVCVEEAPDGMTSVVARSATTFVLGVSALPEASGCPEGGG